VVGDLDGFGELAVEVRERAGDDRAVAARVASVDERLEELGRARLRAEAGDGELLLRQDADAETPRRGDRARAQRRRAE